MKKNQYLTFIVLALFAYSLGAQTPSDDNTWGNHEWKDDFSSLSNYSVYQGNTGKWNYGDPNGTWTGGGWIVANNHERKHKPTINIKDNVTNGGSDGVVLKVEEAKNPNYSCPGCTVNSTTYEYTGGAISSWGNRKVNYGYVEAEIKSDDEYGMWNSFWLWEQHVVSPQSIKIREEIDVFEMVPGIEQANDDSPDPHHGTGSNQFNNQVHDKFMMTSNIHDATDNWNISANEWEEVSLESNGSVNAINNYTQWHIYGVEYTPSKIIYYVDGEIIKIAPNPFHYNVDKIVIMGTGLSGHLNYTRCKGSPCPQWYGFVGTSNYTPNYFASTNFNNSMEMSVRYVSYYKHDMVDCSTVDFTINSVGDLNSYNTDNRVKRKITTTNNVVVNSNSPKSLRASDEIILNTGFEVPLGQELYLDVNACY